MTLSHTTVQNPVRPPAPSTVSTAARRAVAVVLTVLALAALVAASPAEAQTSQWWPKVGHTYSCSLWTGDMNVQTDLPIGVQLTYTQLSGNNYYRWGYALNQYDNGWADLETRVTFVRKTLYYSATDYELTNNLGGQCQRVRVSQFGYIEFSECNTGAYQICTGPVVLQVGP